MSRDVTSSRPPDHFCLLLLTRAHPKGARDVVVVTRRQRAFPKHSSQQPPPLKNMRLLFAPFFTGNLIKKKRFKCFCNIYSRHEQPQKNSPVLVLVEIFFLIFGNNILK